ncbi:IS5 family transposase [bacterium]|nr:IS5 family transposase [bacterium]
MIGKQKLQLSLLDSAFSARTKRSRTDKLLHDIDNYVNWDSLESICTGMYQDTNRGRPSLPIVFGLKCLILQYLYDLSDPALEDALIDRLSFQRFLGISFDKEIPDFTTIWRFRERLIKADLLNKIFKNVLKQLDKRNVILRKGTLVDATLVQAARKKNKNDQDNDESGRSSQQDHDATGTQKGGRQYYGYKGHIAADEGSNIIRRMRFTTASVHDSRELDNLICGDERSVFADKAYADDRIKRSMREHGVFYGILDKGRRGRPKLSGKQKKANKCKSRIRNAVERPFAHFKNLMGYRAVRYVNLKRNELHFMFLCLIHNIRRGLALTVYTT